MSTVGNKNKSNYAKSRLGFPAQQRQAGNTLLSQQLVEFLLVVPFMVIILGILTEYAYALNINLTISQAIKTAASAGFTTKDTAGANHYYGTYSQIRPPQSGATSQDIIVTEVTNGFIQYLQDNNVPTTTENNITVRSLNVLGQTTIFVASYTYIPAFTLPNAYFKFLPDKFNFSASAAVPRAFLGDNSAYNGGYTTDELNQIWASGGSLADKTSFDASRKGILKSDTSSGARSTFIFLIPNPLLASGDVRPAPLSQPLSRINWSGGGASEVVDMANDECYWWETKTEQRPVYVYDVPAVDVNGNIIPGVFNPRLDHYDPHDYIQLHDENYKFSPSGQTIFVHDSQMTDANNMSAWNPSGAVDLSPTSVTGALKRMVSLTSAGGNSTGSFEPSLPKSGGTQYKVVYRGTTKLICSPGVDNVGVFGWTCE